MVSMRARCWRPLAWLFPLLVASVALTGCFSADTRVKIEPDGSGQLSHTVAIDPHATLASSDTEIIGPEERCELLHEEMTAIARGTGVDLDRYDRDGLCGATVTIRLAPSDNPGMVLDQSLASIGRSHGEWVLSTNPEQGWRFKLMGLDQAMVDAGAVAAERTGLDESLLVSASLGSATSIRFEITLPGHNLGGATNANTVEPGAETTTYIWNLRLDELPESLDAQTSASPGQRVESSESLALYSDGSDPTAGTGENGRDGATDPGGSPEELPFGNDERDLGGLLLALLALMATLAVMGYIMIRNTPRSTR